MTRLKDKVAIVTGAAVGIGRSAAVLMARQGAKVAVTDVQDGTDVVADIEKEGGVAVFWKLDTSDEAAVSAIFAEVAQTFGRIDILVNNAGISGVDQPTHEITEVQWDRVMDVNVKGVFFCTKHVVPYMLEQGGGSVINLSSIYGLVGGADLPPYHASKGAVRLMTKNDALLYAKNGIRFNSIHPGFIWTPLVEDLGNRSENGAQAFRAHLDGLHPVGHVGEPDDVGHAVVYLASDEAKFVTGAELVVDGGYTAR